MKRINFKDQAQVEGLILELLADSPGMVRFEIKLQIASRSNIPAGAIADGLNALIERGKVVNKRDYFSLAEDDRPI